MCGCLSTIIMGIVIVIVMGLTAVFNGGASVKNEIIKGYDSVIQMFSEKGISKDKELTGKREYGIDSYVGTYKAEYNKETKKEVIFGGTALHRQNGEHIGLNIKLEKTNGNIEVKVKLGEKEIALIEDTGEYSDNIYIDGQSYYLVIELENFVGNIEIEAK